MNTVPAQVPVPPSRRIPRPIAEYFRIEAQMTARLEAYIRDRAKPDAAEEHGDEPRRPA